MPRSVTESEKAARLSIRASSSQKAMLARAAKAQHMNISQFVLQSSLGTAERVIAQETRVAVSREEYEWLSQLMDAAAAPAPRLRAALSQKPVWEE